MTEAVTNGDAAFEEFYRAHYRSLVRVLFPIVLEVHAAEEVAQEAFLRAYREWSKVARYDDPAGWLHRVAVRVAVSRWRRLRSAATALARYGPAPVAAADADGDLSLTVLAALRELPLSQRQVLVMHHMLGYPVAQIAEDLRVPVGTVKARLSRGRMALALLLADVDGVTVRG